MVIYYFNLQCQAEICNPVNGTIISAIVKNKNSLGLLAQGYFDNKPILEVIITKNNRQILNQK